MTDKELLYFYSENTVNVGKINILDMYFQKALPRMTRYLEIQNRHKNKKGSVHKLLAKEAMKRFKKEREFWNKTLSEWFPDYKPKEIYF